MGYLKWKSALMIFGRYSNLGSKFDRHFWVRGYYVSTVGDISEEAIKKYIVEQDALSTISTFLYPQSVRNISRTSFFTFPYSVFLRYFGINTIWYWHFHRVCDKLESSISDRLLWLD